MLNIPQVVLRATQSVDVLIFIKKVFSDVRSEIYLILHTYIYIYIRKFAVDQTLAATKWEIVVFIASCY